MTCARCGHSKEAHARRGGGCWGMAHPLENCSCDMFFEHWPDIDDIARNLATAERERDEARSEVSRLKIELGHLRNPIPWDCPDCGERITDLTLHSMKLDRDHYRSIVNSYRDGHVITDGHAAERMSHFGSVLSAVGHFAVADWCRRWDSKVADLINGPGTSATALDDVGGEQ